MTQAERGLFERIKPLLPNEIFHSLLWMELHEVCAEFDRQLRYLAGTVEVLSANEQTLEQRLAEAERERDALRTLVAQKNEALMNIQSGQFTFEQQKKLAEDAALLTLTAPLPEKKHE